MSPRENRATSTAIVAAVLLILLAAAPAEACGFVGRSWQNPREMPSAAHEDVLIVYDERTQTEHFVRRVRFEQANESFGFIVPTPGEPSVREAPDAIWER